MTVPKTPMSPESREATPRTEAGREMVRHMRQWAATPERERLVLDIEDQAAIWVAWELGRLRAIEAAARDVDAAWSDDKPTLRWSVEAGEALRDLRSALSFEVTSDAR